ncbi:ribonuclease H-like domain-containing protein [Tanacetum coccineum]
MTRPSVTATTTLSDKLALVTHHHLLTWVPVKLDFDEWNYGSWEYMFDQLCESYEVSKFIHGDSSRTSTDPPPPFTPEELKVDKIILSWIFTTLSNGLQKRLVIARPKTAKEAWSFLSDLVKDHKKSRASALKMELRTIKLGDFSMEAYFQKVEYVMTTLASLNSPVSDDDVVHYVIDGLPEMYNQQAQPSAPLGFVTRPADNMGQATMHPQAFTFVHDNKCTIEFDSFGFSGKDFLTRRVLLRCDSTGDLYPVTAPYPIPHAFLVSQHTWQERLGHPGSEVLRRLVSSNSILCNKEKPPILCHACQPLCPGLVSWSNMLGFRIYGTLSRYKARLMANGSTQIEGIDVDETFSPVVKPVYMHQPPGFWNSEYLDYGIDIAYLLLYVDDIVLTTSSERLLQQLIYSLHQEFSMTDLGSLNYFLGISIMRDSSGMFLSQPNRTPVDIESKLGVVPGVEYLLLDPTSIDRSLTCLRV